MKFILVIAGVLAVLAIVQARPQEAENDNQDEAVEVPSEQEPDQEENDNQIPEVPQEKPHGRPHLRPPHHQRHPGQHDQRPARGPFGRIPRPHRHPHPNHPQQPQSEPQPEEQPNQDEGVIDEAEAVLLDGNDFQILNGSGNDNILINQGDDGDDNVAADGGK